MLESREQAHVQPRRIALLGTRGVPARYGGFETALEEVGKRLAAEGHDVTVYCRSGNSGHEFDPTQYLGMKLVHLPALRHRTLETLSHTFLSALHVLSSGVRFDAAIVCNSANAVALPLFRLSRTPVAVHVDGLEWRRSKWGPAGRTYYRAAEALSVRWADALIADAQGIAQYYLDEFRAGTDLIRYGAPDLSELKMDRLVTLNLSAENYHLLVARFEPENHVDLMIEGYRQSKAKLPLVVVGSNPYPNGYATRVQELAEEDPRIRVLGGVWDQDLLDQLYKGALTYLHGHSVGGTNPSLLRAMGAGTQTIAYDVIFNREVAGPLAVYCINRGQIAAAISEAEANPTHTCVLGMRMAERVRSEYSWDQVAVAYGQLCDRMARGESQRGFHTGRRNKRSPWRGSLRTLSLNEVRPLTWQPVKELAESRVYRKKLPRRQDVRAS